MSTRPIRTDAVKIVLILIAAVVLAGALLVWRGGEAAPIRHRDLTSNRLQELIGLFLQQGFDGATLSVQESDTGRFFQLRKEQTGDQVRLRSDFPYTSWSEPYYDQFRRSLARFRVSVTETSGVADLDMKGNVSKTLTLDFGQDTVAVAQVIEHLFRDIYAVNLATDAELLMRGINPIKRRPH